MSAAVIGSQQVPPTSIMGCSKTGLKGAPKTGEGSSSALKVFVGVTSSNAKEDRGELGGVTESSTLRRALCVGEEETEEWDDIRVLQTVIVSEARKKIFLISRDVKKWLRSYTA